MLVDKNQAHSEVILNIIDIMSEFDTSKKKISSHIQVSHKIPAFTVHIICFFQ